ncbi:MAG TPA: hypothetical protein VFR40_05145 [Lapillicoccus sp.]|nr:hypothetical protein [Lapillicoccus sp.]
MTVTARVRPALVVDVVAGALVDDEELEELDVVSGAVATPDGEGPEHPTSVRTAAATPTVATEVRRRIPPSSLPAVSVTDVSS